MGYLCEVVLIYFTVAAKVRNDGPRRSMAEQASRSTMGRERQLNRRGVQTKVIIAEMGK
jgi:hypothetical protein